MYWHKALWNSIEKPKIKPYSYSQLIFNKDVKTTQLEKEEAFQKIMMECQMDIHIKRKKVGPLSHTIYKNELKMD